MSRNKCNPWFNFHESLLEVTEENCILRLHFASTGARHISWAFFLIEPGFCYVSSQCRNNLKCLFLWTHTKTRISISFKLWGIYACKCKSHKKKRLCLDFFVLVFEFSSIFHTAVSNLLLVCFFKATMKYFIYID